MDIERAYVIIGLLAPPFNHEDYYAVDLLAHILGRGVNPLLNFAFQGRRRLAESVSTRYVSLKYGGAFLVYLTAKPGNIHAAENAAIKFLKRTRSLRYSKKDFLQKNESIVFDYLESAKSRTRLRSEQAGEKGLHSAVSYARYMLLAAGAKKMNYKRSIHETNSSHLRDAAGRYLSGKKYVVVSLVPHKKNKK
ncbi:MAG: insulinase family protein [Candidatus Aminicenantes bacterium]|nr:insulinase family protein [Candidatus Aminicenantes bacterium]